MINEMVNDYLEYLKIDLTRELAPVVETIDDMLTRLEEFQSLVEMVRNNGMRCMGETVPNILVMKTELQALCARIDSLEAFVSRVHQDLDLVESHMDAAEADVGGSEGKLKNILKPLFFRKAEPLAPRTVRSPPYEAPEIFKTSNFFLPEEEDDEENQK